MVKKNLVRVKVIKCFEYPKATLDKVSFLQDALQRGREDMQVFIQETTQVNHEAITSDMFEYEAEEVLAFRFRKKFMDEGKDLIPLHKTARKLATVQIEKKVGTLNHEVSPHLYIHTPELRTTDGKEILREETWYLLEELEDELFRLHEEYVLLLRDIKL